LIVTGVQTCALPIWTGARRPGAARDVPGSATTCGVRAHSARVDAARHRPRADRLVGATSRGGRPRAGALRRAGEATELGDEGGRSEERRVGERGEVW